VQEVLLQVRGHEFPLVAHFALHGTGEVRVHLGTDSGLTAVDVGVVGDRVVVHAQGAGLGGTDVAERVAADLVRVFGERSVFAALSSPVREVRGNGSVALALGDGSIAVVSRADLAPDAPEIRVLLLDRRRRPEARIHYASMGEDGVPGSVSLTDLRDGVRLEIEVLEVLPPRAEEP
jgi:hypothetical protein